MSALIQQELMLLNLWASAKGALGPNALCSPTGNIWEEIGLLKEEKVNKRSILGIMNQAAAAAEILTLLVISCYFLPRTRIPLVIDHSSGVCE
jgi:hypothetical protein